MSKIESIIIDYCKEDKPKYALLIDGKWGEGKTHFLKNNISSKVKDENKEFIYVSLNGIEDTKEIFSQIINYKISNQTNGLSETKTFKIISGLGLTALNGISNFIGIGKVDDISSLNLSDLINYQDTVFCFDDLERISSKLQTEDVLGFLNTNFVEHNNINTIIVCDKTKIEESKDKVKDKTFDIIKEKIIGRVLKFEYETDQVIKLFKNEIINSGAKEKQFYLKHEAIFNEFFHKTNIKNLRTVFFISDNLKRIIPFIEEQIDPETISKILNFTLIISSEFKRGKFDRKKEFYQTSDLLENFDFNDIVTTQTFSDNNIEEKTEETEPDDFNIIYGDIRYSFIESIYDYVFNGYFNNSKLKEQIQLLNDDMINKRPKAEYQLFDELRNWRNKSEDEFKELIEKIKQNLKENKYTLYDILNNIIEYFYYFTSKKLLSPIDNTEDLDKYLSTIIKNIKPNVEDTDTLKQLNYLSHFRTRRHELLETNIAFVEKQAELLKASNEKVFTSDLEKLRNDINFLLEKKNEPFEYLLENMNGNELSNFVINLLQTKNADFEQLSYYLSASFNSSNAGDFHYNSKDKLDKLVISLEERKSEITGKIKNILLEEFITHVKVKSKHLVDSKRGSF